MYKWQNYLGPQLPDVIEPKAPNLVESENDLNTGRRPRRWRSPRKTGTS